MLYRVVFILGLWLSPGSVRVVQADKIEEVAQAHNEFTLDIFNKLTATTTDENIFFGPISITTALAILMLGTSSSATQQMLNVMHLAQFEVDHPGEFHDTMKQFAEVLFRVSENCTLKSANGIFMEQTQNFIQNFLDDVVLYYDAELDDSMDFLTASEVARQYINAWVESKTNNKIVDLIPLGAIDASTIMVIVNAIYFKGLWKIPFLPEDTECETFYVSAGKQITVDMMKNKSEGFGYGMSEALDCKILQLPYDCEEDDRSLSMYVILPNERYGLANLLSNIGNDFDKLDQLFDSVMDKEVTVWLPKFTFSFGFSLTKILKSLGMTEIFSGGSLTGLSADSRAAVSDVIHQAFVEVNEEGTEAAAATAILIRLTSMPFPIEFIADHPFLFVIRDDVSGAILFMGTVVEPTEATCTTSEPTTTPITVGPKDCLFDGQVYSHKAIIFPPTDTCMRGCRCINARVVCKRKKNLSKPKKRRCKRLIKKLQP